MEGRLPFRLPSLALVALLALVAASASRSAPAHRDPCHPSHTCPSDHHTYPWNGPWCTSYADERLPNDTITVAVEGRTYWCDREGGGTTTGSSSSAGSTGACGVERWSVKTLTDPAARLVNLTPHPTTIAALRLLLRPAEPTVRVRGVETTTYRVRARLLAFKLEADSDVHLVIADPQTGGTMIAEFPASSCTIGALARDRTLMARARQSLVRACGQPSAGFFTTLSGAATISGVGFFDFDHGQRGVAPNAIELHPVLSFSSSTCRQAP